MKHILLTTSLLISTLTYADIAVVTNKNNSEQLSKAEIRQIFLGKRKAFTNGDTIQTIDLSDDSEEKAVFTKKVLRKSISSLNAYWSRMLFSSKGQPPRELKNSAEVIETVSKNKNAIAYINSNDVNDNVRVLLTIGSE